MRRIWKRIISIALVGIIGVETSALAVEVPANEVVGENSFTIESRQRLETFEHGKTIREEGTIEVDGKSGCETELKTYEYTNGDICFQQIENGTIVSEYYFVRETGKTTAYYRQTGEEMIVKVSSVAGDSEDESDDIVVDEDEDNDEDVAESILVDNSIGEYGVDMARSTPFTRKGKIVYKLNGMTGEYGVHVAYKTTKRKKIKYNVRGTYQDIADLGIALSIVLSVPAKFGGRIAKGIVSAVGGVSSIGSIIIKDYYVESTRTTRHWRLRQMHNTSNERIMKGRRYYITAKNYVGKKTYYRGAYYRPSEFANKSPELAAEIVTRVYNPYTWSVKEWVIY